MNKYVATILCFIVMLACNQKDSGPLPVIGDRTDLDGSTIIHEIRDFDFTDQLGRPFTKETVQNKIYITDFFFTSCPSICPKVTKQMMRLYDYTKDMDDVILVAHSIDPKRDSVSVLKTYADNLGIDHDKWYFVTGDKEEILDIANEDYFIAALEAPDAPGGFDHSGKLILLDKKGKIRGFCEGTDPTSVDGMMKKINRLRKEYE